MPLNSFCSLCLYYPFMGPSSVGISLTLDPIFKTILLAKVGDIRVEHTSVCVYVHVYFGGRDV